MKRHVLTYRTNGGAKVVANERIKGAKSRRCTCAWLRYSETSEAAGLHVLGVL